MSTLKPSKVKEFRIEENFTCFDALNMFKSANRHTVFCFPYMQTMDYNNPMNRKLHQLTKATLNRDPSNATPPFGTYEKYPKYWIYTQILYEIHKIFIHND